MQLPTIHLNGTSRESLLEKLGEASETLELASLALKQTSPNGRDYYTQGATALNQAIQEHMHRLRRLDAVKEEIDDLIVAIGLIP